VAAEDDHDTAPSADRFLNVCLTWPLSRLAIPADRRLGAGRRYELRMDIGALCSESLLQGEGLPFPDHALRQSDDDGRGDWLEVHVLSDDFAVPGERHAYFLPRTGTGWVCPCPHGERHTCMSEHRSPHLRVPVTAPQETGPARLRLILTHRGNQLQSMSLTVQVALGEERGGSASARIDHTLTSGFTGITDLPERTAGVRVGRRSDGAVTVDVLGVGKPVSTFWLNKLLVRGALARARAVLDGVHSAFDGTNYHNLLLPGNHKSADALVSDLKALAGLGWDLLLLLAPHREQRARLAEVLCAPAEIQVCRQDSEPLMFPWALVYDIPVDFGEAPPKVCAPGLAEVGRNDVARSCPAEREHTYNTLCPFGFWGYRHSIEQPPSLPPGRRLPLEAGRGTELPHLTVARSLHLDEEIVTRHLTTLRTAFPGGLTDCDGRVSLKAALVAAQHDCVYFYCHGRLPDGRFEAAETTVLEIGHADRIPPSALVAWTEGTPDGERSSPLVFLNGCHTTDHEPATWLSLVDAFSGLSAAGVIGTEIPVAQSLAAEVAEHFWHHFLTGYSVGDALHRMRIELLRKNNVLGLAYTAYCSNSLRLRRKSEPVSGRQAATTTPSG
jgi:hypothetical protein